MSTRATCTFQIDGWNDSTYHDQDGVKLNRAQLTKTFHGDLEATSSVQLLGVQGQPATSRAYVAVERVVGRLGERSGSFVLLHTATATVDGGLTRWVIVPDCATGELRGLRGEAQIGVDAAGGHSMTLEYDLDVSGVTPPGSEGDPSTVAPRVELLQRAVDQLDGLIARIRPEQSAARTPCPQWDLRQLVNHVVYDVDRFTATTRGAEHGSPDVDRIGDDWLAAYRAATGSLLADWHARGTDGTLKTSLGEFPLTWAVGQQMTDLAIHGWDVARSLGEPVDGLDADVGEASLAWLHENLKPQYRGEAFGPEVPASDMARLYDRLAAFSGRPID
jgi:uncharacterized protein (TIGR03086 family)